MDRPGTTDAEPRRPVLRVASSDTTGALSRGDLPKVAVERLSFLGKVVVVTGLFGLVLQWFRVENVGPRAGETRPAVLIVVELLLGVAMIAAMRARALSDARKVDLGLAAMVITSLNVGLFRHWLAYAPSDVLRGESPVTLTMLVFAAVVPVPPRRMVVGAILAGLADVLALVITVVWVGRPSPPPRMWVWLFAPNVVGVVLAFTTSSLVHRLGEAVVRVREAGAYRLVERIGRGGMGEVWRAEHQSLARPAAVKLVAASQFSSLDAEAAGKLLVRFEREAKLTASLKSPHTIAVYDFGRTDEGAFYYVMELLDGLNLDELVLGHGPLPEARVVAILAQLCESLGEAHAAGMIHRDVKPANVFLCARDFAKVLDFGLVKLEDVAPAQAAALTDDGAILGTPAFLSPEVARGLPALPASDVYAVGCVAYWLLTGRYVFADRPTPVAQIAAHMLDVPDPPSKYARVSAALDALVMRCLDKEPAARPTCVELDHALAERASAAPVSHEEVDRWWAAVGTGTRTGAGTGAGASGIGVAATQLEVRGERTPAG